MNYRRHLLLHRPDLAKYGCQSDPKSNRRYSVARYTVHQAATIDKKKVNANLNGANKNPVAGKKKQESCREQRTRTHLGDNVTLFGSMAACASASSCAAMASCRTWVA
jgi:hypothetical protein